MSVEVYVRSRPKLKPDPEFDEIGAIFYHIMNDIPESSGNTQITGLQVLATDKDNQIKLEANMENISIDFSSSEYDLIKDFVKIVYEHDPDMITGYETHQLSWGYIIKRARFINIDLISALSRIIKEQDQKTIDLYEGENEYEMDFKIEGRIILNIWKLLRSEASLYSYTFENMMFHILHKRVPKYDDEMLSSWWNYGCNRWKVIEYFIKRVQGNVSILEQLDLFGRNSELARLFGIQFYEVISRGSQFRVESMMLRLAKSQNYVSLSPSVRQRARMRSGEYIPLVMEPESKFYTDPVILLDFQSLYPSIIMAYNYCFTTCLGRVLQSQDNEDSYEFGCSVLPHPTLSELARLEDHLTFSPGGIAFLKASVRKGILPEMLHKILDTRVMVKRSMKLYRDDNILKRTLHARQLGLKLIANVTYGYTSANFSGRMPCIEVGDSVVSKGRETLERCIKLIESHPSWNGRVVYGDTDSVFVLLKGRTKEEAFNIGDEMAKAVTLDNPKPVKLKFEKVYMGCILQTKKRYVGYMYESRDQSDPIYDAKGIETVRRDGCPAVAKILEKSLRILFETKDVIKVRTYVQRQFHKILSGKIPLQDLTFAKEFRGLKGYRPGACVPSLELTRRLMKKDRMNVPRIGQRVPYIIIYGEPGRPLIQSVRSPQEVMESGLRPNSTYYVSKVIGPPLDRCFSLLGVDIHSWYNDLPKGFKPRFTGLEGSDKDKRAILRYFTAFFCAVCDKSMSNSDGICSSCKLNPQSSAIILNRKMNKWSGELSQAMLQCLKCTQLNKFNNECVSIDCPMFYKRNTAALDSAQIPYLVSLLDKL
ncbi:DNA polymerase zeta catalytic subunit [Lepeophtheirus salmonis]|uniref:DNA polymerase zeta catalytic subunit n=1 Tax=Lepeophtheirus salmonis TaxID=72036 RepID=UPI003AF36D80